jgi:hypothetical protein
VAYWWADDPSERYWAEITDRDDLGADLKCPQADESGKSYWSYSLIHEVWPGDVVFHYSTKEKAFTGASVAGGPVEERPIIWTPHGTVGRSKRESREPRPGWWRPLYGFRRSSNPLSLAQVHNPKDELWIREWIQEKKRSSDTVAAPFQLYPGKLRAAQGYLVKMPQEFVERWPQLQALATALEASQDQLTDLGTIYPASSPSSRVTPSPTFKAKDDSDYLAFVKGGVQRRSRSHERLVRLAGERLKELDADIATPHPIDLLITSPRTIIVEAKTTGRGPLFAIREAVGQLFEYRHFLGPANAELCILLDQDPGGELLRYVEEQLGLLAIWLQDEKLLGGPQSAEKLGLSCPMHDTIVTTGH